MRRQYGIALHSADGFSLRQIARMLHCSPATVTQVQRQFTEAGEAGLIDRRGDNGQAKINTVEVTVQQYGHRRPTWTPELLIQVLTEQTWLIVCKSTMSRLLRRLGIRRGMPKPTVGRAWSPSAPAKWPDKHVWNACKLPITVSLDLAWLA